MLPRHRHYDEGLGDVFADVELLEGSMCNGWTKNAAPDTFIVRCSNVCICASERTFKSIYFLLRYYPVLAESRPLDAASGKPTYCLCQLKQRIITRIRPSFTGCLNADL